MAQKAGFDGNEVHGAKGYIIDHFLRNGSNKCQDRCGGNIENRMRCLNEVLNAVCRFGLLIKRGPINARE